MREMEKRERLDAKRAAFQGEQKRKHRSRWIILVFAGLLAGGLISYLKANSPVQSGEEREAVAGASTGGSSFVLPVSTFDDGRARFYSQKEGKIEIRFFVLKSSDGVLRAAFDACDVCWRAGKGYAQDGDSMVCRNCGRRFVSVLVNEIQGGCNPAPLTRKLEDGSLIIEAEHVRRGKGYFDFSRKG